MEDITEIRIRKRKKIDRLNKLFKSWILINEKYSNIVDGDCSYVYSERTNCGMVSAAAYAAGMVAVEEIPVRRRSRRGQGAGGKYGRYDLYISDDKCEYMIEAKQVWEKKNIDDAFVGGGQPNKENAQIFLDRY